MARALLATVAVALLAVALVPVGAAHAAPAPRPFETRLLHDHNDDSAIVLAGKHGFDSIALDAREARLPSGEDVLVLRLILNGGCNAELPTTCPALREVVRFDGPTGPYDVAFETADGGLTWSGNAVAYVGPEPLNDGTRFAIEAWVPFADFGGAAGAKLTAWFVAGYAGEETADDMPAGAAPGLPDPLGAAFDIGSYSLAAREYVRLDAGETPPNGLGGVPNTTVDLAVQITNLVALEQNATFGVTGPAVLLSGETPVSTLALAPNFTADLVLRVTLPNGTAAVGLSVATPLGGFANLAFEAAGEAPQAPANTTDDHEDHDEGKDTPGLLAAWTVPILVAAAVLLRRRP